MNPRSSGRGAGRSPSGSRPAQAKKAADEVHEHRKGIEQPAPAVRPIDEARVWVLRAYDARESTSYCFGAHATIVQPPRSVVLLQ
jgi:hypothetical protein